MEHATRSETPVVLSPAAIDALPSVPVGSGSGTTHRVLWHEGGSMAGVLTVPAGARLGAHAHRENHHHVWVLEGRARILGLLLGPGSYVHIPHGVVHDFDASDTEGCTVFYLYQRPTP